MFTLRRWLQLWWVNEHLIFLYNLNVETVLARKVYKSKFWFDSQTEVTAELNLPLPKPLDLALGCHILSKLFHLELRDLLEKKHKITDILCNSVEGRGSLTYCRLSHSILTLASLSPGPWVIPSLSGDPSSPHVTTRERIGSSGRKSCCRFCYSSSLGVTMLPKIHFPAAARGAAS